MAEEVTIKEAVGRTFFGHAILTAMSAVGVDRYGISGDGAPLKIELVINGVPTPLRPFFDRLEEGYEHTIRRAVGEEIKRRFQDKYNKIYDVLHEAERKLTDELRQHYLLDEE